VDRHDGDTFGIVLVGHHDVATLTLMEFVKALLSSRPEEVVLR